METFYDAISNIEFLESVGEIKKHQNIDHLSKPCENKVYIDAVNRLLERSMPTEIN